MTKMMTAFMATGDIAPIVAKLRATGREELIHFAGAMHRDPAAYEMIQLYLADPSAPEYVLTARRLGITARQIDQSRHSYDPMARARLSTDYYGADGWPASDVPAVTTASDGTIVQSMERPGQRTNV